MENILIFSKELDEETNLVMGWLDSLEKVKIIRVNTLDKNVDLFFSSETNETRIKKNDISKVKSVWFRKFPHKIVRNFIGDSYNDSNILKQLNQEVDAIYSFLINTRLNSINSLGSRSINDNDKLFQLHVAKSIGLNVPKTIVTTRKSDVLNFFKNNNIIVKAIGNSIFISKSGKNYGMFSENISRNEINNLPDCFQPSLFQERINKQFEIRTYYLKGAFFSTAIFSSENVNSQIDYRKTSKNNTLRYLTVDLSDVIKDKLTLFMEKIQLDSGAFDFVVDQKNKIFFLEINPFGQFKQFSDQCNYKIEKHIAEILLSD
jgi:glutathione synthase/RimK-type ligase-like ATP-grasp enzyme